MATKLNKVSLQTFIKLHSPLEFNCISEKQNNKTVWENRMLKFFDCHQLIATGLCGKDNISCPLEMSNVM